MALLLVVAWLQYGPVTLTYQDVPADVTDIRIYHWRDDGPPVPVEGAISRRGTDVVVTASARASVVAVFVRRENDYVIDGPFFLARSEIRPLADRTWRRSGRGALPSVVRQGTLEWLGAGSVGSPWPRCFRDAGSWECWGIGPSDRGVMTLFSEGRLWWIAANPLVSDGWRSGAWGRMLVIRDPSASSKARVTFAHPVTPASSRFAGIRLETAPVPETGVVFLQPNVAWAFGERVPPKAWMEVRSESGGPSFVHLEEVAAGGVAVPLEVRLSESRTITGTVTGLGGQPASKALVTLFRLIDPQPPPGSTLMPRRVFAAEQTTDENGEFAIGGRGEADYELLAWHPQFGRTSVLLEDARDRVSLKLDAAGLVRGRVVSRGRPIAGVDVVSVPDAEAMMQTRDITEIKGGDATTGPDGRFVVALASTPGGELRIGGGTYAIRRVPLPRSAKTTVDLGDVELEEPIEFLIVIDGDPGCAVQSVGPIGKIGLQVVTAIHEPPGHRLSVPELGLWQVGLLCTTGRRLLQPDSIQVTRAMAGTTVRFTVR